VYVFPFHSIEKKLLEKKLPKRIYVSWIVEDAREWELVNKEKLCYLCSHMLLRHMYQV